MFNNHSVLFYEGSQVREGFRNWESSFGSTVAPSVYRDLVFFFFVVAGDRLKIVKLLDVTSTTGVVLLSFVARKPPLMLKFV